MSTRHYKQNSEKHLPSAIIATLPTYFFLWVNSKVEKEQNENKVDDKEGEYVDILGLI